MAGNFLCLICDRTFTSVRAFDGHTCGFKSVSKIELIEGGKNIQEKRGYEAEAVCQVNEFHNEASAMESSTDSAQTKKIQDVHVRQAFVGSSTRPKFWQPWQNEQPNDGRIDGDEIVKDMNEEVKGNSDLPSETPLQQQETNTSRARQAVNECHANEGGENEDESTTAKNVCLNCGKIFSRNNVFSIHLRVCVTKLEGARAHDGFVCCHCGQSSFTKSEELYEHKKRHHPLEENLECVCGCCSHVFATRTELLGHVSDCAMTHFAKKAQVAHKCDDCGRIFTSSTTLKRHRIKQHAFHPSYPSERSLSLQHGRTQSAHPEITFSKANRAFNNCSVQTAIVNQGRKVIPPGNECLNCGKIISDDASFLAHLKSCVARLRGASAHNGFVCCFCSLSFFTAFHLYKHKKRNHLLKKNSRRTCGCCSFVFANETEFLVHLNAISRFVEKPEETRKCEPCGQLFTSRLSLERHKLETHSFSADGGSVGAVACSRNDKFRAKYRCLNCGKISNNTGPFVRHLKSCPVRLVGAKAHNHLVCCHCGRSDFTSYQLWKHKKMMHPMVENSIHTCGHCGKSLISKSHFIVHLRGCLKTIQR